MPAAEFTKRGKYWESESISAPRKKVKTCRNKEMKKGQKKICPVLKKRGPRKVSSRRILKDG